MAFLEIESLSFAYEGARNAALRDVSFSVEEGEFCLLLSPNGGGKTTLLSLIHDPAGLQGNISGKIRAFGGRAALLRQDPELGLITDKVWREIAFSPENRGLPTEEIRLRAAEAVGFLGLERIFDRDTATLSGSEKVKTLLASLLADRPDLFLLDEPAGGLDPMGEMDLAEALSRIRAEYGGTILLSEQNCDPFFAMADRILYLEDGKLLFNGKPKDAARFLSASGRYDFVPEAARLALALGETDEAPLNVSEGKRALARRAFTVKAPSETESAGETLLSLSDLSFRFERDGADLIADLDLSLRRGEALCILGKGGSGKSSLLRLLAGDLRPARGKRRVSKGIKIAYLPQDVRCVFEKETVREELLAAAKEEAIGEAAERFDLQKLMERHPLDLSGGERRRLALAKIFLLSPDAVLLDEPTRGLDGASKRRLIELLIAWKRAGAGLLIATHDAAFAARVADRCGLLFHGELAALAKTEDFFRETRLFTTPTARITGFRAVLPEEVEGR